MAGGATERLTFYRAADVAERLGCSHWWVKEQARNRRIPYCWIGGSCRFTEEHVAEIARLTEVQPAETPVVGRTRRTAVPARPESTSRLVARVPRRARAAGPAKRPRDSEGEGETWDSQRTAEATGAAVTRPGPAAT
ncbi:helix-turn-helix domain-containing protein [Actinoplanes palleronii]|uniref:Helix-turn-helix domain-containing protein n=1 Tax=Actinoplanes palleronii TaxID=113570 RepID=A0ABQ4B1L9_9ACTN|nr:hypothetical protein Apa02nite_006710 [Actinoplanes palleronii]